MATKITINEIQKPNHTLGVGSWVILKSNNSSTEYLCVIAQISNNQCDLICITTDEANRMELKFRWSNHGDYNSLSDSIYPVISHDGKYEVIPVDVEINVTPKYDNNQTKG